MVRHRRQRVQVEREARDEGLALAGLHLGDVALVEDDPAHHLDVEHALVRLAHARLADGGVGLEQQLVELLAVLEPRPELGGLAAQLARPRAPGTPARAWRCRPPARPAASSGGPRRSAGNARSLAPDHDLRQGIGWARRAAFVLRRNGPVARSRLPLAWSRPGRPASFRRRGGSCAGAARCAACPGSGRPAARGSRPGGRSQPEGLYPTRAPAASGPW